MKIYKPKLEPVELFERLSHKGGVDLSISLICTSFSLTATGSGEIVFSDGEGEEKIKFSGNGVTVKRKVDTGIAFLNFTGEFDYEIYNLAGFALITENESDIPLYEPQVRFDMKLRDPLFLAFADLPRNAHGKIIPKLRTEGSAFLLPHDYEGEILVSYKRMPAKINENELDTEIDIAPECEHLLPLRTAAYLLLDGNEELSEYYLSLYKSGIGALKQQSRRTTAESFSDVLRWA